MDELVIAQALAIILSEVGFAATAFEDPESAITAAAANVLDLLLSDAVMPGITGSSWQYHFRGAHPKCKVLLFSGQTCTGDLLEEARGRGYDFDLRAMPVHPAGLLAKIRWRAKGRFLRPSLRAFSAWLRMGVRYKLGSFPREPARAALFGGIQPSAIGKTPSQIAPS